MIQPTFQPAQREQEPPCRASCPSGTDIRGWIAIIAQRKKNGVGRDEAYRAAWETIVQTNPFPAVMGRICPGPCESGCNRIPKDGAVAVNQLERFLGDWALERRLPLPMLDTDPKPESVGVIGAGPAGLSSACQMARRGYAVTVYECQSHAGGMLRYGIPPYRLPRAVLDAEVRRILDLGVELRTDTRVGADITLAELESRHPVLFLGIGAHRGLEIGIPGEDGPDVWTGAGFLASVSRGESVPLGRQFVVVGGGDTAIDAARTARRTGAHVTLLYRRTRVEMPALASEVDEALLEGIRIEFLAAPVRIVRCENHVVGVEVRRMTLGAADASGRRQPVPVDGSEFEIQADTVIAAISQEPDWNGLEAFRSRIDGTSPTGDSVHAAGDVLGPGVASRAIAQGRIAAEVAHARLRGTEVAEVRTAEPAALPESKLGYYASRPRLVPGRRRPEDWLRLADVEIHTGITEEQFEAEVTRCLSCGQCFGCETCWMYCAHECFDPVPATRPGMYFTVSLDRCGTCGQCIDLCPCGFLQVRTPDPPIGIPGDEP